MRTMREMATDRLARLLYEAIEDEARQRRAGVRAPWQAPGPKGEGDGG